LIDEKISDLYKKVSKCSKCHPNSPIHVPGPDPCNGGIGAEVLFILERPGTKGAIEKVSFDNKDGTAERAKRLLKTAGISRKNIFIANTVFCRDKSQPTNVKVTKDEKDACSKYLKELIDLIQPTLIVTLGEHALRVVNKLYSLGLKSTPLKNIIGKTFSSEGLTFYPLYHTSNRAIITKNGRNEESQMHDWKKIPEIITRIKMDTGTV